MHGSGEFAYALGDRGTVRMELDDVKRFDSGVGPPHLSPHDGEWELPVLGAVTAPTAALVRPDGYVAWVGNGTHLGLPDALATWFGRPTAM
jgi:hypothetical protein